MSDNPLADLWMWATHGDNGEAKDLANGVYTNISNYIKNTDPNAYYKGPTYAGAGKTTQQGWGMATDWAGNKAYGGAVNGALGNYNDLIGGNGLSGRQSNAFGNNRVLYNSYGNLGDHGGYTRAQSGAQDTLGNVQNIYQGVGAGNGLSNSQDRAQSTWNNVGQGYSNLGDHNGLTSGQGNNLSAYQGLAGDYADLGQAYDPNSSAYRRLRSNAGNDALTQVNSLFNSSGRFGGGSNAKSAAEGVANAYAGLDYTNMQNDINNQYRSVDSQGNILANAFGMGQQGVGNQFNALAGQGNAAQSVFNNAQTGIGNKLAGAAGQANTAQSIFNNAQTGTNNQFNALNGQNVANTNAFNWGQQGINNQFGAANALPGLYDAGLMPSQTYGAIGAAKDANRQGQYTDAYNQWNAQRYAPLDFYNRISQVGSANANVIPQGGNNTPGAMQLVGTAASVTPWFV